MTVTHRPPSRSTPGSPAQPDLPTQQRDWARAGLAEAPQEQLRATIEEMVLHPDYPCLGARSVFRREGLRHVVLDDLDAPSTASVLADQLEAFDREVVPTPGFHSFLATFRGPVHPDEAGFERSLFTLLERLHEVDGEPWADGVGSDPADPHFAFSVRGAAYFVVGLHPAASRVARRTPLPTVVFNPHEQFEQLRREGRFDTMRTRIRARDEHLQGDLNPMVADHGDSSEARQYSGRYHGPEWVPPLHLDGRTPA